MRKLANNTFTKGLFKDFHPLTVGNDVMTDALNATIVTMNGNEGILQNDMGNGRVESAFLPAGYVPVGMKEYGGIIYVASYNPVTNKGLIGSFPSPERNIDLSETGGPENPLILLDEAYIRLYKYSKFNYTTPLDCQKGIAGLVNKTDIFGKDRYMRAGDKFGFYFHDYDNNGDPLENVNKRPVLSNYYLYDYKNDKPYSGNSSNIEGPSGILNRLALWDKKNQVYRNNIITLSTLILDVNNNLRDITELLKRFNEKNEKIDTKYIKSKTNIFNSGYFINESENTNWDPVNIERNKKALNTYNNKLYGKMFLVGKANTLEYIENGTTYTSYSSENGKYIEIVFNVNYFYNCPEDYLYEPILYYFIEPVNGKHVYTDQDCTNEHNVVMNSDPDPDNPSDDKKIYGESNQEYFLYDLINEVRTVDYKDKDKENYDYDNAEVIETYDPITNLYKRTYQIRCKTTFTEGYLHYVIVPRMKNIPGYDNVNNPDEFGNKKISNDTISQLTHLAIEGTIDFSKIGTGFNGMLYWNYRYLETIDGAPYMQLRWGLDDYLLTSDEISDLKMEFFSLNESGNVSISESNSIFEPPTNPDLGGIISDWERNKLYRDGIGEPMPRRNIRETTPLVPKPSYTLNVSDKYSYTGPFMEYLYLNETELKKRHIYIVKLSRIKNGQYEFLAYRILITTSIYNDLFSGDSAIDDYCADNVANIIHNHNKIEFDLDIIESVKYKTSLDKDGLGEVYEKDNNGQYVKTNKTFKEFIYKSNDDITPPAGENLLVEYYKYTKQSSIEINIHIPDKYPFSINKEKFGFENVQFKQINEYEYDKYPENVKLPILDIINNPTQQKTSEYRINGSNYTIATDYSTSNNNFTIEDTTYFPSVMIYKYLDNTTKIRPKYLYKNLIEYILELLESNNKLYYEGAFPIIGSDGDDKKFVWVDMGYFQLEKNISNNRNKLINSNVYSNGNKDDNISVELYNVEQEKYKTPKKYRLFDSVNVNKFLEETIGHKLVYLFASPLIFEHQNSNYYDSKLSVNTNISSNFNGDSNNTSRELISKFFMNENRLDYNSDNTGDCNFLLREKFDDYLTTVHEFGGNQKYQPRFTYWSWAYIVWRGYGDTFNILNKMLYKNSNGQTVIFNGNLENLIKEIFNKLWYIYFRRDNDGTDSIDGKTPVEIEVYPFYPIAYNYDYIAKSCTEINVPSITINDDAIYYYLLDENRDLIQSISKTETYGEPNYSPKTSLNLDSGKNYQININPDAKKLLDTYSLHENLLLFEPIKSGIKSNTKLFQFKIPQVQYVNDRSLDIQGLIKHKVENDYMIYIRDVDGYSLSDLFYNVTDGDIVLSESKMDSELYDFVNYFTVKDNLMIIRLVYGIASDSNKVYMGCNAENYKIIMEIGGCGYIELPDWRTISTQKNYYTIFGNRTAYYASGGGLGGGSRTNSEAAWSGEGGRSAFGQSGGGSRTGNTIEQSATDN